MQDEQRRMDLGPEGRRVDGEDPVPVELAVPADGLPAGSGGDGHVPDSLLTTGPSASQLSDSIDQ